MIDSMEAKYNHEEFTTNNENKVTKTTGSNNFCKSKFDKIRKYQYRLLAVVCILESLSYQVVGVMSYFNGMVYSNGVTTDLNFYMSCNEKDSDDGHDNNATADTGSPYAIFYHVYINPENIDYSHEIVAEQMAQWQVSKHAKATLYYTHLGDASKPFPCPCHRQCVLLNQKPTGDEYDTLLKLSEYCQEHSDHNAIYLHSKGSFHPKETNNPIRKVITASALSDECHYGLQNTTCNICSALFSPLPHWHSPGNMWSVQCRYIQNLYPILDFASKVMEIVVSYNLTEYPAYSLGVERYANEHWVYTHPHVYPCDVYPDLHWLYGYGMLDVDLPLEFVERPPRNFTISKPLEFVHPVKFVDPPPGEQIRLKYRLFELQQLYNLTPANDSFAWTWYDEANLL